MSRVLQSKLHLGPTDASAHNMLGGSSGGGDGGLSLINIWLSFSLFLLDNITQGRDERLLKR